MRLPRPLAAPVTKATLPSRRMMGFVMKKLLVPDSGKTECPQRLRAHSITFFACYNAIPARQIHARTDAA